MGVALMAAGPVALEKSIPRIFSRALFAAGAFAIGFDSGADKGSPGLVLQTLLGTWAMVIFLLFDVAYYTSLAIRTQWVRVGVRVVGSWIIAISLLVLALSVASLRLEPVPFDQRP